MQINFDPQDLEPLIQQVTKQVIRELRSVDANLDQFGQRLGFTEPEAASLLGVQPHTLRDMRLRGEITAQKIGKRYIYSRESLLVLLGNR